jgi:cytochrome P450
MATVKDLLERRSNTYSDRPAFTVVGEMMQLGQSMPLLPYGPEWRACRKLAHVALSITAVAKYHHAQEALTALLLRDILDQPKRFFDHVRL